MPGDKLDHAKFKELFRRHYTALAGYVYGFVKDEETARDIVHDAFLTLWNNRASLDASYSLKAYLFTLGQNYALNFLRHRRVETANSDEAARWMRTVSGEDAQERESRYARVREKIAQMPERQREVFLMCVYEGRRYQQVADVLGVSINTVKKQVSRAFRFLRDELGDDELFLNLMLRP